MRKQVKIWSLLLMLVLASSYAVALQQAVPQQAGTSAQLDLGGPDVITASDAGGGYLSTRDILLILLIIFAVIGLIFVL